MSIKIGQFQIDILSGGKFLLDGGTMFGVVPKSLWSKGWEVDEENRIEMETNCLLVRDGSTTVLIEAGIGYNFSEKEREIYGIHSGDHILASLKNHGVEVGDVDMVILTHLHFDHAGGVVDAGDNGKPTPVFQNAKHMVQKKDWEDAMANYGVMKSSYQPEKLRVLEEEKLLHLMEEDHEPLPGIRCVLTPGHCRGHQVVIVESEGQSLVFCGDLIPTASHVKASWLAAYDLFPYDTFREKKEILESARQKNRMLTFYHDPKVKAATIKKNAKGDFFFIPVIEIS